MRDRARGLRWIARVVPREFRERVFEPALADIILGEGEHGKQRGARVVFALECLRIGLTQHLWHKRRPTRAAWVLGATAFVIALAAARHRYSPQWKSEAPTKRGSNVR